MRLPYPMSGGVGDVDGMPFYLLFSLCMYVCMYGYSFIYLGFYLILTGICAVDACDLMIIMRNGMVGR